MTVRATASPAAPAAPAAPAVDAAAATVDPITLEVIRHGLISAARQVDANITRTAFSPYIYEYKDYAVGLLDADGNLIAQNTGGMPIFVADSVGMAVRDGLELYGRERLTHGDVLICNHAAVQGQHLNNVVMYTPIFGDTQRSVLIGFFAINMHWIDVGGSVPRSTDIFMEGLQFRSIKLVAKGEAIEEIYRVIENNTRFPAELLGDIAAQLSGCLAGRDLVAGLAAKYGVATFRRAVSTMLDQTAALVREKIRAIPDGSYRAEAALDGDGVSEVPIPIKVGIVVAGDGITIDYSGLPGEVAGCINAGYYGGGRTTARVAFKYLIAPEEPANEGMFRPLQLILPPHTLLSADPTAPMGNYNRCFPTVIDAVIRAFEQALPERVTGGHFGHFASLRFMGQRPDRSPLDCIDGGWGGWGAGFDHDGSGPFRTMAHGDSRIIPIELQEAIYPFRIEEMSLWQDSGGAGQFRGGLGIRKVYRVLEPCQLRVDFDRRHCPPWGVRGGKAASGGWVTVVKASGERQRLFKTKSHAVAPGDVVIMEAGGGGGYGPPRERARELVLRDLHAGYISDQAAEAEYGMTLSHKAGIPQ
jgi:N-methylhydantoinase B